MHRRDLLRLLSLSTLAGAAGCTRVSTGPDALAFAPQASATSAGTGPDVDLELTAAPSEMPLIPGEPTRVWRFTGRQLAGPDGTLTMLPDSYLGPVIRLRRGQRVRIRFLNRLGEDSIVHWHGLDVPEDADGHPRLAVGPGREYVYEFTVTNRAGTYWYHPHPHMRTGAQVYYGLAGLLLVTDPEEDALALPSGQHELLCVLQDRLLDGRNQLLYHGTMMEMMNGVLGDRFFVSGRLQPTQEVDAAWHRVRLLNGSNARIYKLAWSHDLPMTVIGSDGGLLEQPVSQRVLTLAPGQRADVLVDLSGLAPGTEVLLNNESFPADDVGGVGMMGGMGRMGGMMGGGMGQMDGTTALPQGAAARLMTLRVGAGRGPAFSMPARLPSFDETWAPQPAAPVRRVPLLFQRMTWLLGGRTFAMEDVASDETVARGSTHVWEIVNQPNGMGMEAAHPIHIHGRQFRVLDRRGSRAANTLRDGIVDAGWTDTVLVLPGETVRVQVTFTEHPGLYLYHCHILEHEDMGMMRNFRVV
jgi:FtsP/CotA-like multicopper oxidase with cupredoxin domain